MCQRIIGCIHLSLGLSLLLLLAHDIELNQGPRPIRFPCGECGKAVKGKDHGIACDSCEVWFHTKCIGVCDSLSFAQSPDISWHRCACGLPDFSSGLFAPVTANGIITCSHEDPNPVETPTATGNHPPLLDISRA